MRKGKHSFLTIDEQVYFENIAKLVEVTIIIYFQSYLIVQ